MNNIFIQKYGNAIKNILLIAGVLVFIFAFITYLIPFFAPFFIAILITLINEPVIGFLERFKMPRKLASLVSMLFTTTLLVIIISVGIYKIYNELTVLRTNLTMYSNSVSNEIINYFNKATAYYNSLPDGISNTILDNVKSLTPKLEGIITSFVSYLLNTLTSIPKLTIFAIVTLLSTYFISSDRKKIKRFLSKQFPEKWMKNFTGIKIDTFKALLGYFRALLILMFLTFVEVTAGLFIIKADYALLMGLLVAISDAIPIVGTGVVMIPWILWCLISGKISMALGLVIIYLLGVIIRQILEPKIVGDQINLHPLVTLIAMYIGLEIFGIAGMFIGPITLIILKNLQAAGIIKIWNE